ncbi:unnamed protein product [Cunninghamella blakesleeana]
MYNKQPVSILGSCSTWLLLPLITLEAWPPASFLSSPTPSSTPSSTSSPSSSPSSSISW